MSYTRQVGQHFTHNGVDRSPTLSTGIETPEAKYWFNFSRDANLVCCISSEGYVWAGNLQEEPKDYADYRSQRGWLGSGGRGYIFAKDDETTVTHNLWSWRHVPAEYAHFFTATHDSAREFSLIEDNAYWAEKDAQ